MDQDLVKTIVQLFQRYIGDIQEKFPELVAAMLEKPFRAADTGIHPKVLADWKRNDLLLTEHKKNKRHDFSLTEVVWIKLIQKFRDYNFPLDTIRSIRDNLIVSPPFTLEDMLSAPEIQEQVASMLPQEHRHKLKVMMQHPAFMELLMDTLPFDPTSLSQLEGFVIFTLAAKRPFSIMVDHEGDGAYFSPILFETDSIPQDAFMETIATSHVSISITDAVIDVLGHAPIEKVVGKATFLTENEETVLEKLRADDLVSVTVRYDRKGAMDMIEVTEDRTVDHRARLIELILKNGYEDIQIKTQNGGIATYRNTRKIKLK